MKIQLKSSLQQCELDFMTVYTAREGGGKASWPSAGRSSTSNSSLCFPISSSYVAQLFYLITKIKWEYDTQPNILKGGASFSV